MQTKVDGRRRRKYNLKMFVQMFIWRFAYFDCAIGDSVHCPYFNKGLKGVNKVVKGRDMDIFSRTVKKGKSKEFLWASLVGVFMDGCLCKYATLDGPFLVVGIECFEWNYNSWHGYWCTWCLGWLNIAFFCEANGLASWWTNWKAKASWQYKRKRDPNKVKYVVD